MLQKQGHHVDVADNGKEAVTMSANGTYDIILMDVQMPVMDGLDATRAIRAREAEEGGDRMIIVAMTAHAMKGDREMCIEAGMDDYLSKPIRMKQFSERLKALFDPAVESSPSVTGIEMSPSASVAKKPEAKSKPKPAPELELEICVPPSDGHVDWELASKATGHDVELLRDLIGIFLDELPGLLKKLDVAVNASDADGVKKVAHKVKGSVLFLNTKLPFEYASKIEQMGAGNELEDGTTVLAELKEHFYSLAEELKAFLAE